MTEQHKEILIIEDDEGISEALAQLFALSEVPARIFSTAADAIAYIDRNPGLHWPLIFMDGHLPDLSAAETVKQMRQRVSETTLIYLISADASLFKTLMGAGISGHFPKPFDAGKLIDLARQSMA